MLILAASSLFAINDTPINLQLVALLEGFAGLYFAVELLRILVQPNGMGESHFLWQPQTTERLNSELRFVSFRWLPLILVAAVVHLLTPHSGEEAIGRAFMIVAQLAFVWHVGRLLTRDVRSGGSWLGGLPNRVRVMMLAIFVVLIANVIYGQVHTVTVVLGALLTTLFAGTGLLLLHETLMRWLRVARRRLRLAERLAQRTQTQAQVVVATEEGISAEEQAPDLGDVSSETQQLVTAGTIIIAGAALIFIWSPLLPALDAFARISLWSSTSLVDGEAVTNQITLATLVTVGVLAVFTLFAAKRLPALVEIVLRNRPSISPSARYTVSTLLNYAIVGTGIIAGLGALGLQWGQLQWLVAALGVGIGFGLQEIVANFISGLIILFERPIRVGDIVTIGDKDGVVTKIRIRATTLRDWDGKELLVPNKEFITGRLLNWTPVRFADAHHHPGGYSLRQRR